MRVGALRAKPCETESSGHDRYATIHRRWPAHLAVLVGFLMNVSLFNSLSARLLALESKVDTKLDPVAGKLAELDNELFRVEERLSIH
jgi:hypothetical protein